MLKLFICSSRSNNGKLQTNDKKIHSLFISCKLYNLLKKNNKQNTIETWNTLTKICTF